MYICMMRNIFLKVITSIFLFYTNLLIKISYKIDEAARRVIEKRINQWREGKGDGHIETVYTMLDDKSIDKLAKINISDDQQIVLTKRDGDIFILSGHSANMLKIFIRERKIKLLIS